MDLTLERYRDLLTRGAVLIDDSNQHEGLQVLVTFRHAVCDGRRTRHGKPQTISERLQFVWLDGEGRAGDGGPAPHLDCRAIRADEQAQVEELLKAPWLGEALEDRARSIAMTELVPRHVREVRERRLPELDRIEAAVRERMLREITHLQHRALELETQERAGKKPRLNSENVRRQCEALSDRRDLRIAEIKRQRDIASLPPEICGAALVIPAELLQSGEAEDDGVIDPADTVDAATRKQIEMIGMNAVMERERTLGHTPRDVSAENRGYDIESRDGDSNQLRFIEVKGRRADAQTVTITRNELLTAWNARDQYTLAIVLVEDGKAQPPIYVGDPAPEFGPEPAFREKDRRISIKGFTDSA